MSIVTRAVLVLGWIVFIPSFVMMVMGGLLTFVAACGGAYPEPFMPWFMGGAGICIVLYLISLPRPFREGKTPCP